MIDQVAAVGNHEDHHRLCVCLLKVVDLILWQRRVPQLPLIGREELHTVQTQSTGFQQGVVNAARGQRRGIRNWSVVSVMDRWEPVFRMSSDCKLPCGLSGDVAVTRRPASKPLP